MKASFRAPGTRDNQFERGLELALSDDGRVGPNDAPALRKLAKGSRVLRRIVDRLESAYEPPTRRVRLTGSGYGARVIAFEPGAGAGFNANRLDVTLGRPEGATGGQGSLHVVSLGENGRITMELGRPVTRGVVVFENGLPSSDGRTVLNPTPAKVEVSADGQQWIELRGQAGLSPVFANSTNGIFPGSRRAGGDRFLFLDAGIPAGTPIKFVRITDLGQDPGPRIQGAGTRGFDLDAVYGF